MNWVSAPLKLQDKVGVWTQETHYDLPNYDLIVRNANVLFKEFRKSKSIFGALVRTFRGSFTLTMVLIFLYSSLNLLTAFITAQIVGIIVNNEGKLSEDNYKLLIGYFVGLLVVLFLTAIFQSQANFLQQRMSYLAKNCLNFLLFQKVLNFDVLNGSFSEGKIVNMI